MLIAAAIVVLSPFCGTQLVNNGRLHRFASNLCDRRYPRGTEVDQCNAQVGLIAGNGRHCDYQARATLISNMSRQQLIDYFNRLTFPGTAGHRHIKATLYFQEPEFVGSGMLIAEISEIGANSAGLDLRCGG